MRIIDLSQTMEPGMQQYPGQPIAAFHRISNVAEHGVQVTDLHTVVHVGTHCDAPAHFILDGETMEQVPLERFVGEAAVVDVTSLPARAMTPAVLEGQDIRPGDIVLFHSGSCQKWGDPAYLTTYPYIGEALAHALVDMGVKAIGLDFISPDPVEEDGSSPAHHILLGHRLGIVENLRHLDRIASRRVFFSAAPIKIKGGDGAFARAYAVEF